MKPSLTDIQETLTIMFYKKMHARTSLITNHFPFFAGSTSRSADVEVEKKDLETRQNSLQAGKEESADWI